MDLIYGMHVVFRSVFVFFPFIVQTYEGELWHNGKFLMT